MVRAGFRSGAFGFSRSVGGLTVGLMGYFVPEVLGVGYDQVEKVLNGDMVLQVVVMLAVLKIIATAVCYASGNAGGIFGPSLFIGAMMGAAVGSVAHHVLARTIRRVPARMHSSAWERRSRESSGRR